MESFLSRTGRGAQDEKIDTRRMDLELLETPSFLDTVLYKQLQKIDGIYYIINMKLVQHRKLKWQKTETRIQLSLSPLILQAVTIFTLIFYSLFPVTEAYREKVEESQGKDGGLDYKFVVGRQIALDAREMKAELEAQAAAIKFLKEQRKSPHFAETRQLLTNLSEYREIINNFQGNPYDVFLWLLMAFLMAHTAVTALRAIRPPFIPPPKMEYPLIPLIYFQQTYKESITKRDNQKQLTAIAKKFIIRANETYIDLDEIRNAAITRQTLARSPWTLIRFMIRLQIMYSKGKRMEEGKAIAMARRAQIQERQHMANIALEEMVHERFAKDVINKIEATHHHPESRTNVEDKKKATARDLLL